MASSTATIHHEDAQILAIQPFQWESYHKVENMLMLVTELSQIPPKYEEFTKIFSKKKANELPMHNVHNHSIKLEGSRDLLFRSLYNLSENKLKVLQDYLVDNLAKSFIQTSTSLLEVSILFMKKKDGTLQLCINYHSLNQLTQKNWYFLPLINKVLNWLVGAKMYIKLNIHSTYNLIWIKEGDKWKTAFWTWYSHFKYHVILFRLVNTSATFQEYINSVLRDCLDVIYLAYLDDILIIFKDEMDYKWYVHKILQHLSKAGLYLNLEKCKFWMKWVGFVSYIITSEGITMELDCVSSIHNWFVLRSHQDVQVFLSFANFYQHFMAYFLWIV